MLLFVLHHLGDPLEVEFVKPGSFTNSFLPHVFGVTKWFLQIKALPKPTPVHYSGFTLPRLWECVSNSGPETAMSIGNTTRMLADATRPVCTRHSNTARAATSAAKMRCNKTSGSANVTQKPFGPSGQTSGSLLKKRKMERPRKSSGQLLTQEILRGCA